MMRAAVLGASGYIGGELLRLLLAHPNIEIAAAVSTRLGGRRVDTVHPNLRSLTDVAFRDVDDARTETYDVVFLATPHGATAQLVREWSPRTDILIDLSGDFRLGDTDVYRRHYGKPHDAPELLDSFTPGIPELCRAELRDADFISVPGCMATAGILALYPLAIRNMLRPRVMIDARTGSSGSGTRANAANLHAERSGALRVFAPVGHRHEAEISQQTGLDIAMSATGVEAVRGVQVLCHAELNPGLGARDVRNAYREQYGDEPFVRIVAQKRGYHRYPDPKILAGSNFCDVGFEFDPETGRLTLISALDNLVKGGAGSATQSLNIRAGNPEGMGLSFPGLHPC